MSVNRFLVVVDMQNDFVDGALGSREACEIVEPAVARISECRNEGYCLIATLDTHPENYMDTQEGHKLPVPHCIKGSTGWELNPEIREALGDCILLEKPTFGSIRLPELIHELSEDAEDLTIELIGLCTDICVVSNALLLKAHFPEAKIGVRASCCAGVTPEKHDAALATMASCQIDLL